MTVNKLNKYQNYYNILSIRIFEEDKDIINIISQKSFLFTNVESVTITINAGQGRHFFNVMIHKIVVFLECLLPMNK